MAWYNPSDRSQRNSMLGGLALLLVIVPFNMFLMPPKKEANLLVADRLESLEIQNRQATAIPSRGGADLEERMVLYERHVARLEELIPAREEVAMLFDDIQSRARRQNVDVLGLDPEPIEPAGPYDKTGYQMTVVGEYHDVARFLVDIASLSRILTPVQVDLSLFANPLTRPNMENPVQATFRIETYVLQDQAALASPEVPGGSG